MPEKELTQTKKPPIECKTLYELMEYEEAAEKKLKELAKEGAELLNENNVDDEFYGCFG